jgi:hypothetical protein
VYAGVGLAAPRAGGTFNGDDGRRIGLALGAITAAGAIVTRGFAKPS